MNFKKCGLRKQLKAFATKIHRLAQESVISFPRSASTVNNSPRFTEFLRIAVEKYVNFSNDVDKTNLIILKKFHIYEII